MPSPSVASPEQLRAVLARGPASANDLSAALRISVPTVHRLLNRLADAVVSAGKARRARYALVRPLRGSSAPLPVYAVDEAGQVHAATRLVPLRPEGSWMDLAGTPWPVPDEARDGWWAGLPYPLQQMRPQGYMGRQFAQIEHRALAVAPNPLEWSDDDVLFVMSQRGTDLSGNLIVGEAACEQWLVAKAAAIDPLPESGIAGHYLDLAGHALAAGVAGSSAAGEFPKFTARRTLAGSATPHVLVKFSGVEHSAAVRRWSDLLVCEHLASLHAAAMPGVVCAASRVLVHGGRTFLEVERFDRQGAFGRSPLCALDVLNAELIGESTMEWPRLMARLAALDLVTPEDEARVQHLWWFGRLIGNTDMHTGNLSFRPEQGRFALAPLYDMLPMRYAPLAGGEVPARELSPVLPLPPQREVWLVACAAAIAFWRAAAADRRIGNAFRAICAGNVDELMRLRDRL
ncbi:type II toxin-antitoxin system HipA family toxin YjjJ [Variovorax sp. PAMC28562]|uniref:type II toxin-antitoxin system HipA family toxin YjjJ n=1 Tax=Variovorax sp. PAMC28562 TaxID=2762323 RepID=UPI00164DCC5B|nr:type II toxin-antitoxin system HipA family toxin YjjJ [Variovorax sp. PAMC28562]QNK72844.1 type II toxin-antitoxin system HipA family toxin YjjJ [Variovorax sp. PAMC28562]